MSNSEFKLIGVLVLLVQPHPPKRLFKALKTL